MASLPPQTPGDAREDHAVAAGAAVAEIYAQAELTLIAAVASLARKAAAGTMVKIAAARRLRKITGTVFAAAAPKIRAALDEAMAGASEAAHQAVTGPAVPSPAASTLTYTRPLARSLDAAAGNAATALQDALAEAAVAAGNAEPSAAGRPVTAAARTPTIFEQAVGGAIRDTRGGMPYSSLSLSRIQAAQKALDDLGARGITGFTDRAGRNWDLTSYVEMATRTAVSNAWDDMQAQAMTRSGLDLIFTWTHSTEGSCPLCIPWLGRTLSLTGATAGYPALAEAKTAGFRHPSCRCSWTGEGTGVMDVTSPVGLGQAAKAYKASQEQRALERNVRAAGRRANAAITPQARSGARRDLDAAKSASAAHRQRHRVVMTKAGVRHREHPFRAR